MSLCDAVGQGLVSAAEVVSCFGMMKWGGSDALCPLSMGKGHCAPVIFLKKNGLSISNGLKGGDAIVFMMVYVSVCVRERQRENKTGRSL